MRGPDDEILLRELSEVGISERKYDMAGVEDGPDESEDVLECRGVPLRGGGGPVDVAPEEEVEDFVPREKGDLLRIEGAEERRRAVLLEGLLATDGEDKLCEKRRKVLVDAILRFRPQQRFRFPEHRTRVVGLDAEIDISQNPCAVIRREAIRRDLVLDFLFLELRIVGHVSSSCPHAMERKRSGNQKGVAFSFASHSTEGA